jgi:mannonate dehydratase
MEIPREIEYTGTIPEEEVMGLKLSFRWYGSEDPVTLGHIRQIPGMHSIVTAVYDVPPGGVWSRESIQTLKDEVEQAALHFDVVESVPVHEDIKLGLPARDRYIENYCENLRRLGEAGVRVVCYNFMPVFDWTRTQLDKRLPDGSTALVYYKDQLASMDPLTGELSLPGWDASYKKDDLRALFEQYAQVSEERLWENLAYFLERVIPIARESGVKMAIHPDDPPWNIFGLPRIITGEKNLDRFLRLVDDEYNGLTLCTGSLGCCAENDIYHMVERYSAMGRIHFLHARNVKLLPDGSFEESAHPVASGSLDLVRVLSILHKNGFTGYLRPDHGRMIWGETGRPGYGLYDRALGAMYLSGIWDTLEKTARR